MHIIGASQKVIYIYWGQIVINQTWIVEQAYQWALKQAQGERQQRCLNWIHWKWVAHGSTYSWAPAHSWGVKVWN